VTILGIAEWPVVTGPMPPQSQTPGRGVILSSDLFDRNGLTVSTLIAVDTQVC